MLGVIGVLTFLLIWELTPRLGLVSSTYLPPASEVLLALGEAVTTSSFWLATWQTMFSWGLGLLLATAGGLIVGIVVGSSRFLRRATHSTIEFLRPIPAVGLIPLAVLIFGVNYESTIMLVVYACFWQVLIQVLYGVADIDTVASNTARSYGLKTMARIRYVVWPTTLPYFMTGLRLAASVALILAITAQLIIGSPGLGNEIALAQSGAAISTMYALILTTGLIGVIINLCVRGLEKAVLGWHPSVRGEIH